MSSPAPLGNSEGGTFVETEELCGTSEPITAAVSLSSNERITSLAQVVQSTATVSTCVPPSGMFVSFAEKIPYKLLSKKRRLVNFIQYLRKELSRTSSFNLFNKVAPEFYSFDKLYSEFRLEVENLSNPAHVTELICHLADDYDNLRSCFKSLKLRFVGTSSRDEDDVEVKASDTSLGRISLSSKSSAARRIEIECKRAGLLAIRDLEKSKSKAEVKLS